MGDVLDFFKRTKRTNFLRPGNLEDDLDLRKISASRGHDNHFYKTRLIGQNPT